MKHPPPTGPVQKETENSVGMESSPSKITGPSGRGALATLPPTAFGTPGVGGVGERPPGEEVGDVLDAVPELLGGLLPLQRQAGLPGLPLPGVHDKEGGVSGRLPGRMGKGGPTHPSGSYRNEGRGMMGRGEGGGMPARCPRALLGFRRPPLSCLRRRNPPPPRRPVPIPVRRGGVVGSGCPSGAPHGSLPSCRALSVTPLDPFPFVFAFPSTPAVPRSSIQAPDSRQPPPSPGWGFFRTSPPSPK